MLTPVDQIVSQDFDYVIVGGGTAGLVLAARLSEDPNVSVVVLEGGDANLDDASILRTGVYGENLGNANYDWAHMTTKQKALADRQILWSRGRGLGGSSGLNFMVWQRPPAEEVDDFERLGNAGWNFKTLHKYIKKAEGFVDPPAETQKILNIPLSDWDVGRDGPLHLSYPLVVSELEKHLQQAFFDVGFPKAKSPYSGDTTGAYFSINTYHPEKFSRTYSASAYYVPNKERSNLKVLVNAHANRVETTKAANGNLVATAVEITHGEKTYLVKAKKEVILSAGALSSPVVLERSGIGRKEVLENAKIPVKLELPGVGENMQDHILSVAAVELKEGAVWPTFDQTRDESVKEAQLELYKQGKGSFAMGCINTSFVPLEAVTPKAKDLYEQAKASVAALDKSKVSPGLLDQYKIQLDRLQPGTGKAAPGCEFLLAPGLMGLPIPIAPGKKYLTAFSGLQHPFSRGTIHVTSSDPKEPAEIDPHYFEQSVDFDILKEQFKMSRKLIETPAIKDFISHEIIPGPAVESDEQISGFLGQTFGTIWHTSSTCSMLPREKDGVVDNHLKVYGTENLRVVDLSIVPLHFSGHPQGTVYGIAELAADLIKGNLKL
ncbi:alcohol oxidase [Trametopsis cervina]|nr:alcohol oxidase [Trametopsis cervina]